MSDIGDPVSAPHSPSPLEKYREWLVKAEHQASQDFDKAILTLAGGALGLSLVFVDPTKLVGPLRASWLLGLSWLSLAVSLLASLSSLLTSRRALRISIEQLDSERLAREAPGGKWATYTERLNVAAACLLFAGVIFLVTFGWLNMGRVSHGNQAPVTKASGTTAPAAQPTAKPAGKGLPTSTTTAAEEDAGAARRHK